MIANFDQHIVKSFFNDRRQRIDLLVCTSQDLASRLHVSQST